MLRNSLAIADNVSGLSATGKISFLVASTAVVTVAMGTYKPVAAVTINFDSLAAGTVVTNQFPEATFSSNSGFEARTFALAGTLNTSVPNVLGVTDTSGSAAGTQDLFVDFTNPINNLTFNIGADNSVAPGLVNVFTNGLFNSSVNLVADGNAFTPELVDLSSFANVTRIEVVSITDGDGIVYDDFSFDVADVAESVPEPGTVVALAMLGGSFLLRNRTKRG
ncbi:MAG: PEP-CTERM sorting domain-containing protein [Crocosphaera sp.]